MNGRPIKRRRLNPFVDVEAVGEGVGEGEESDEETELAEGASSKFAPIHVVIMPDVFQDVLSQDEADLDISFLALQNAMQEAQHVDQWDSFLEGVLNRGRNYDIPHNGQEWLPSGGDRLWEIGCAVSGPFDVNPASFDPYADRIGGTCGFQGTFEGHPSNTSRDSRQIHFRAQHLTRTSVCRGLNTGAGDQFGSCDTRAQREGSTACTSRGDVGQAPGAQSTSISTSILGTDSWNRQGLGCVSR